jgi:hypothetical protein
MLDRAVHRKDGWHYFIAGQEVTQKAYEKLYPPLPVDGRIGQFMTPSTKAWPYTSNSVGCHPIDRQAFMTAAAKAGVPTEFNMQGKAVFTSREHQKQYAKAFGLANFDETWSGGGDKRPPQPKKKRPRLGNYVLETSDEPPKMRTETRDAKPRRRRKGR